MYRYNTGARGGTKEQRAGTQRKGLRIKDTRCRYQTNRDGQPRIVAEAWTHCFGHCTTLRITWFVDGYKLIPKASEDQVPAGMGG